MVRDERVRILRVVAVSPGDVEAERRKLQNVVDELNRQIAPSRGCVLSLWRWETDTAPTVHLLGPQGAIDERMRIADADIVVGIFWKRFGTPTHASASGTEHELRRAWAAWQKQGSPEVMVYFCTRAYAPTAREELAQWDRVLAFQQQLPEEQLWWKYRTVLDFEALLRAHITRFVLDIPSTQAVPRSESEMASEPHSTPDRTQESSSRALRWLVAVLAAAAVAIAVAVVAWQDKPTARIVRPTDGATVRPTERVSGRSSHVPGDRELWLLVSDPDAVPYYPQVGATTRSSDGSFQGTAFFGVQQASVVRRYELSVVSLSRSGGDDFRAYFRQHDPSGSYPGVLALPGGADILDTITVKRTP